jgi:chemotaxis response regulator CheB/chemotaxis methyl-accepting protein methylase
MSLLTKFQQMTKLFAPRSESCNMISFTEKERNLIFSLTERLIGSCQNSGMRKEILVSNVARRMDICSMNSLDAYLVYASENEEEFEHLISALTIHTTSWFRELPHFIILHDLATEFAQTHRGQIFRVWCAACSTGEEVYSFAAVLERIQNQYPHFSYEILGTDVDPRSIKHAKRAVYYIDALKDVPADYKNSFLVGSEHTREFFTLTKALRDKCHFETRNLINPAELTQAQPFQFIVCRNVLIYFNSELMGRIINSLTDSLDKSTGYLCLGHSESIPAERFGLELLKNCVYSFERNKNPSLSESKKQILVIDDSQTIRTLVTRVLSGGGFKVLCANNAAEASEILSNNLIDGITLDVNMPGTDGLTWLSERRGKGLKTPVIVLSDANPEEATAVLSAMGNGAQEFIEKGKIASDPQMLVGLVTALVSPKLKTFKIVKKGFQGQTKLVRPDVIVIGASTGGTEALTALLAKFPKNTPPILVVQHISTAFAPAFAARLAQTAGLTLGKFETGTLLECGHLYMSTQDLHIEVANRAGALCLRTSAASLSRHCPSVDALFLSTVESRATAVGILLTGMGRDGAVGLLELHSKGMVTCAQDEASCVVFGMPKEAIALGGASFVGNISEIRQLLEDALRSPPHPKSMS